MTIATHKKYWTDEELLAFPDDGIKREIINGELVESGSPDDPLPSPRYWTDEELLAMPKDGYKREIIGGILVMSPANVDHGAIINRIVVAIGPFVYSQKLGELPDGQTGFRLKSGDVFSPDIAFLNASRMAEHRRTNASFFQGAPDFFVEVLSPSDTVEALQEKLDQFFAEGTRLAWIIHPRKRCAYVYRSPNEFRALKADDYLDGEDIIPGFKSKLSSFFIE